MNRVNKFYGLLAICLLVAIAARLFRYQSWNRYYYAAGAFAPALYPVYVKELYFITADGEDVHADTEAVNNFTSTWGADQFFAEASLPQLLPERMVLRYASVRDSSFYSDTIILAKEKIAGIVDSTFRSGNGVEVYDHGRYRQGFHFITGIANNGNIILWLINKNGRIEITRMRISAKIPGEYDTYYGGPMSSQEYLKDRFSMLSDSLEQLIREGVGSGAQYADSTGRPGL